MWSATAVAGTFHATYNMTDFVTTPLAVREIRLQPVALYGVNGPAIISGDFRSFQVGANGSITVSNLVNGRSYKVSFYGPNIITVFTNSFDTNVSGVVNAADYIAPMIRDAATVAYSQAAADARFVLKNNAAALTNGPHYFPLTPAITTNISTLAGVLALSYMPSGTVAYIQPGFYNLGTNNLVPPVGVSVIGAASELVTFYGYSDCWGVESTGLATGGPQYNPRDNSLHQGFRLLLDATNMMAQFTNSPSRHSGMWSGFGCSDPNPPANKSFTNVVVRDVIVEGGWFDAFHHNPFTRTQARYEYCRAITGGGTWNFRAGTIGNTAANSYFELESCEAISEGNAPAANIAAVAVGDQSFIDSAYPVIMNNCFARIRTNNVWGIAHNGAIFGGTDVRLLTVNGGKFYSNIPTDGSYSNAVGRFSFNDRMVDRQTYFTNIVGGYSLELGQAPHALGSSAFIYGDGLDRYAYLTFHPGRLELEPDSIFHGNLAGGTNLPAGGLRIANGTPLTNGVAGMTLVSLGTGGVAWSSNALLYVAKVTQTSTAVPTASVITNTFPGSMTYFREAAGIYGISNSAGAFTTNKTFELIQNGRPLANDDLGYMASAVRSNNFVIRIYAHLLEAGLPALSLSDDNFQNAKFEIRTYP